MEDLFAIILTAVFEILGEFLAELVMAALADVLSRLLRHIFVGFHQMGSLLSGVVFALMGCGAGLFSLAAFPHAIF